MRQLIHIPNGDRTLLLDPTNQFIRNISQAFDLNNTVLLEIGCGTGRITRDLALRARAVVAVDPDANIEAEMAFDAGDGDERSQKSAFTAPQEFLEAHRRGEIIELWAERRMSVLMPELG